ncbi:alpha/beta hydrolase [Microbulbifer bruguierae]|uniref:Alpha/beta hydrolase n=1 Tax=Microbulbifer bruguierae TaxID=3029061 RepID=A0ABY8NE86_9GAMM|nr:alpha/beta hydrolase [Microbulbifer bruguierae]WGL17228.1 alpha/beta hydrolase [Microbulbifer bruguierae]
MSLKITTVVGALLFTIVGCAIHNTPDTLKTSEMNNPNEVSSRNFNAFVDQNGTFYPPNWKKENGSPCKIYCWNIHYSLIATAASKGNDAVENLSIKEAQILENMRVKLEDANRVYILVHGYNNDAKTSRNNYDTIKNHIEFQENDVVIEFFWDGLVSKSSLWGDAKIWFRATGYSQLAGSEGLRDILNLIENKEIIIISHSRGASVALSALSNPPYSKEFAEDTLEFHTVDVYQTERLQDNKNIIKLLMLAPAIGDVDFRVPDHLTKMSYREFGDQLTKISYTVNPNDKVLKKFLDKPNVSGKFNPTDLGFDEKSGEKLKAHYGIIQSYDFSETKSHKFDKYIENENFKLMLSDLGVDVK